MIQDLFVEKCLKLAALLMPNDDNCKNCWCLRGKFFYFSLMFVSWVYIFACLAFCSQVPRFISFWTYFFLWVLSANESYISFLKVLQGNFKSRYSSSLDFFINVVNRNAISTFSSKSQNLNGVREQLLSCAVHTVVFPSAAAKFCSASSHHFETFKYRTGRATTFTELKLRAFLLQIFPIVCTRAGIAREGLLVSPLYFYYQGLPELYGGPCAHALRLLSWWATEVVNIHYCSWPAVR